MRIHKLKTLNPYFSAVFHGKKLFEVRINDRDYQIGDLLLLQEYNLERETFLSRNVLCEIIYILDHPGYVKEGWTILGFEIIRKFS